MVLSENAKLHNMLNEFVMELIRNPKTNDLWDADHLNRIDREDIGEVFVKHFINEYEEEVIDENGRVDKQLVKLLNDYCSKAIDRLIPKIYFLEYNEPICRTYTPLLVRRIFDVDGMTYPYMSNFKYHFNHSEIFSEIKKTIEDSTATEKQIQYLNDLGKNIGYLLWHEEYLSKNYANQLIEYLSEKNYTEPAIFSFFFVSK